MSFKEFLQEAVTLDNIGNRYLKDGYKAYPDYSFTDERGREARVLQRGNSFVFISGQGIKTLGKKLADMPNKWKKKKTTRAKSTRKPKVDPKIVKELVAYIKSKFAPGQYGLPLYPLVGAFGEFMEKKFPYLTGFERGDRAYKKAVAIEMSKRDPQGRRWKSWEAYLKDMEKDFYML
jgi:hypothetical protein